MIRSTISLALIATSAAAEFPAEQTGMGAGYGCDQYTLEQTTAESATLTYLNCAEQHSEAGIVTLQVGQIVVDVEIFINRGGTSGGDEMAVIRPRGGYVAIPEELMVTDGMAGVALIVLPMF